MFGGNVGNTKEYVQCLAFAYFAVHKYPINTEEQESHKISFYNLFVTSSERKKFDIKKFDLRLYKDHLGDRFPFIRTIKDFNYCALANRA